MSEKMHPLAWAKIDRWQNIGGGVGEYLRNNLDLLHIFYRFLKLASLQISGAFYTDDVH